MTCWWAIPFLLCMAFYAVYLWRCAWFFARLSPEAPVPTESLPLVTVVVPARNEVGNIGPCVRSILRQRYPVDRFELIVVDDQSEDGTAEEARAAAGDHPGFRLLSASGEGAPAYKKAAVAVGIAASRGEWIVTTDADCQVGPGWLEALAACFRENTALVSGPVLLTGKSIFQEFQSLEFMGLVAVGAGSIAAGNPNMCNGANLAYRKRVFEEVGGFSGIDHIASGDDELLLHKIASQGKWDISFCKNPQATVRTPALENWSAFAAQRRRWVSKSTQYKQWHITLTLVLAYLAVLGIPVLGVATVFWPECWPWLAGLLGLKLLGEGVILYQAAVFFDKLQLLKWLLPEQAAHVLYVLWVGLAGNRRTYSWKGRQVQ